MYFCVAGFSGLPDPFEPWLGVADLMDMGEWEQQRGEGGLAQ
jgi:hypothetical protein